MFHISFILVLFLYQLSVGCMALLALMPLQEVDVKFYQLSSGLSSLLLGIGLALSFYYPFQLPDSFAVTTTMLGNWPQITLALYLAFELLTLLLYIRMRRKIIPGAKALVRLSACLGIAALAAEGMVYRPSILYGGMQSLLLPLQFISAAIFLGVFMLAMIFGHWYLIKSMPKKLLRRVAEMLIVVLVFRILMVAGTWWVFAAKVPNGGAALQSLMDLQYGHGMFFWMRILIGLAIPALLSYMIWSTAKIGANQSATGLLYVGVVFVIIGELISKYIFLLSSIPI